LSLPAALGPKSNDPITPELQAAHVYLQLAILADAHDLPGMAAWLRAQSEEEREHAQKFIDHVVDRGGHAVLGPLEAPGLGSDLSVQLIFKTALDHEQKVSEAIRELGRAASAEGGRK